MKVLILGGTTEASALAQALTHSHIPTVYSYAGRVASPKNQPVPVRAGGFGGVDGLAEYLSDSGITHIVDATHPFAEQMSRNAVLAAERTGTYLIALSRPPWQPLQGDRWHYVSDIGTAVDTLAGPAQRVMLAIGRMHLEAFQTQPQHHYLLRLVDAPIEPLPLPNCTVTVDRGPFTLAGDLALLREQRIELVVCKNAGGEGAAAKLTAARELGLPVLMIDRPALPHRNEVHDVGTVLHWLGHGADRGV
jgi:precorrin-6A/cobalt-precorrin-6A reductase